MADHWAVYNLDISVNHQSEVFDVIFFGAAALSDRKEDTDQAVTPMNLQIAVDIKLDVALYQPHAAADQFFKAVEAGSHERMVACLKGLSKQQLGQLRDEFQARTGYEPIGYLMKRDFGFLSRFESPEINSLEQVYERVCMLEQLEAVGETYALTNPRQLFGELLRSILSDPFEYGVYYLQQMRGDAVSLVELLYSYEVEELAGLQRQYKETTGLDLQAFLQTELFSDSELLQLATARLSAASIRGDLPRDDDTEGAVRDAKEQADADCLELISACKGYKPQLGVFFKIFLLGEKTRMRAAFDAFPLVSQSSIDTQIKLKFAKQPTVEYIVGLLVELDQDRRLAKILRKGIKDNREACVLRIVGHERCKQVVEAYSQLYREDPRKQLIRSAYGVYKKVLNKWFE